MRIDPLIEKRTDPSCRGFFQGSILGLKTMHYYQFNIGDYASHTRHLNVIEDCAYRRLLDFYYLHEKPIKQHDIARQINMREHEQEVLSVLNEFFLSSEEGFVSPRANKEIEHYHSKIDQASKAGKASAERRFNGRSTDVQPTNNQEPLTNNHKPKVESTRGSRLSTDFCLTEEWSDFCIQDRPDLNPSKVFETFKDYWIAKAGQQGVKLDWFATWRNWVRSQNQAVVNKADQVFTTVPSRFERDPALIAVEQKLKEGVPMPPEIRLALERLRK
jgi:uncharacterized protein YdaU (DUF1376 family)